MQESYEDRQEVLKYAKANINSFASGSVSSNEIYFFEYNKKKYVLKKPLVVGDNLSPFWFMMKNVFHFTFEKQNFQNVYNALKKNPHIPIASFIAADERVMIFEFVEGNPWTQDEFPKGSNNAYRLGQYVGYNHQSVYKNCGIKGSEDVTDFFPQALMHMEANIETHWNSESGMDRKMRTFFSQLKKQHFESSRNSLIMVDMSADQFLFDKENIVACVDMDAYVIGPVEWELSFLHKQVEDWDRFKAGYEKYQCMPPFEEMSDFFFFLMALNSYENKCEIEEYWSKFFVTPF